MDRITESLLKEFCGEHGLTDLQGKLVAPKWDYGITGEIACRERLGGMLSTTIVERPEFLRDSVRPSGHGACCL